MDIEKGNFNENINLAGFEILEQTELDKTREIIDSYVKKLQEHGCLDELKLTLRQHPHGKSFKHKIKGIILIGKKRFSAEITEWNLYKAISEVCEKLLAEVIHSFKKEQRHDKLVFK